MHRNSCNACGFLPHRKGEYEMTDILSIIKEQTLFSTEGNIIHFILNDSDRPWWSKQLEGYFTKSGTKLYMSRNYKSQKQIMTSNPSKKRFIDFVSDIVVI